MHPPATAPRAPLPVLRAAVFAVVGTVLGVSAHHLLVEGPVPWAQGAAAAAVLFGLGLVGTRRPRRLATVVVCSVAGQSGLHLWLTLTAHAGHMRATAAHQHGGQLHDAHAAWHERLHDSVAMTAAHALVAVLVAVLLHRADVACWTLARGVTAALDAVRANVAAARMLCTRPPAPGRLGLPVLVPAESERPPAMGPVLAYAVVRRGPPPTRAALVN
ncbi:hypothetical protein [Streptomyces sp. SA15]|uniref:hypothetical protein n=1 Tax=Streptomyces sp. SA15 TaxID=934019 RepID=UPI00211CEF36|nr:hypothetical protein [Streptomyces sp. SA15]